MNEAGSTSDVMLDIHSISLLLEALKCFCSLHKMRLSIYTSGSLYELNPNVPEDAVHSS
jgi:hypothetical protein